MQSMSDGYKGIPNNRQDFLVYVKGDHLYTAKLEVYYERAMIKTKGICDIALHLQEVNLIESPEYIEDQKFLPDANLLILGNSN